MDQAARHPSKTQPGQIQRPHACCPCHGSRLPGSPLASAPAASPQPPACTQETSSNPTPSGRTHTRSDPVKPCQTRSNLKPFQNRAIFNVPPPTTLHSSPRDVLHLPAVGAAPSPIG